MRLRLPTCVIVAALGVVQSASVADINADDRLQRPNLLFVLSDDHAVQSIGCYGTRFRNFNPTPNIDRLAEDGVRFANAFVQNSICAPSRAAILTGKCSHQNGVRMWEEFDGSQQTMPKLLQYVGYHTVLVGKWHLKSTPTGFDDWTVLPGQGRYFDPTFHDADHGKKNPIQTTGYVSEIITQMATDAIRSRPNDKPLAIFVHHKSAHTPFLCDPRDCDWLETEVMPEPTTLRDQWKGRPAIRKAHNKVPNIATLHERFDEHGRKRNVPERFGDPSEKGMTVQQRNAYRYPYYIKSYLRTARSIDRSVGELLRVLEEERMTSNTTVVYMSDQGFYLGEHGMGDKRWAYEESMRTPLIIKHPNGIKGIHVDALVMNIDIAPTLLSLANVEIPDAMQGRDLCRFLTDRTEEVSANWRERVYYRYYDSKGYRIPQHQAVRTTSHKLIYFPADRRYELFDLKIDPAEMNNLANNLQHRETLREMQARLTAARREFRDTDPDIVPERP